MDYSPNYVKFDGDKIIINNTEYKVGEIPQEVKNSIIHVFNYKAIPQNTDWLSQIKLCETGRDELDKEVQINLTVEKFKMHIKCLSEALPHVNIPSDILNRIAYEFYEPDIREGIPYLWDGDNIKWRNWWLSNPVYQSHFPIYFCNLAQIELVLLVACGSNRLLTCSAHRPSFTDMNGNCIKFSIPKVADIMMGIHFDDISNIKSCSLNFIGALPNECAQDFPFILTDDYTAKCMILPKDHNREAEINKDSINTIEKFYFHPIFKAIPIHILVFTLININITLKDRNGSIPNCNIIESMLDQDIRHEYVRKEYFFEGCSYKIRSGYLAEKDYYEENNIELERQVLQLDDNPLIAFIQ